MVAAYRYAQEQYLDDPPPKPFELTLIGYIDRFGVEAVMGRPVLSAGELRRMYTVENIYNAYNARKASEDWAKWAAENPARAAMLAEVEGLIHNAD